LLGDEKGPPGDNLDIVLPPSRGEGVKARRRKRAQEKKGRPEINARARLRATEFAPRCCRKKKKKQVGWWLSGRDIESKRGKKRVATFFLTRPEGNIISAAGRNANPADTLSDCAGKKRTVRAAAAGRRLRRERKRKEEKNHNHPLGRSKRARGKEARLSLTALSFRKEKQSSAMVPLSTIGRGKK